MREVSLVVSDWKPITFDGIEPTLFEQIETPNGEGIALTVKNSSSFLVFAFQSAETISCIRWDMRYSGLPGVENRSDEASKIGDDFVLRVGLITAGDRKQGSMFAPNWIKQLAKIMNVAVGNVVYLVASRHHPRGSTWKVHSGPGLAALHPLFIRTRACTVTRIHSGSHRGLGVVVPA